MALDPQIQHIDLMKTLIPADRMEKGGDLAAWQQEKRALLIRLLGMQHCIPADDEKFEIDSVKETDAYTETRFFIESEPGVTCVAHLRVPKGVEGKLPLVICLQGHSKGMHISMGQPKYPGDAEKISGGDRDFARQIVARGYAALILEQRAFGERGGTEEGPGCYQVVMQALLLGRTLIGERCWDVSRAIDMIEKHFPQIDMEKVALMGNSGGGTATIYAAALDERIAAAMPSCAFCGYKASIGDRRHCSCNYVPGIMKEFDMGDLGALIAPRPLIVVNGLEDKSFPLFAAKEQMDIARVVYEAAGAKDKICHVIGLEGHRFYAAQGWPVFDDLTGWRK